MRDMSVIGRYTNHSRVFCLGIVYEHHASKSGYDRLIDFVGTRLELSDWIRAHRDGVLKVPCKLAQRFAGVTEYTRHDCAAELNAAMHMRLHRRSIYHVLYGERSLRFLPALNGFRKHRVVATFHHPPETFHGRLHVTRHLSHLAHAIAVSTNQVELLAKYVGADNVSFVPHGIDTDYWRPLARPASRSMRRVVFTGSHLRDFAVLEAVLKHVTAARRDVEFVLLSHDERCAAIAGTVPRVRCSARLSDDKYQQEVASADLLLLPLRASTATNAVLEALACGVPIITTRGGISDYLDDSCAIQLAPADVTSMAEATIALLDDDGQRERMGTFARQRALSFDWHRVAAQMRNVYQRIT